LLKFEKRENAIDCSEEQVGAVSRETGLQPAVAQVLCEHGVDTPEKAKEFLNPDASQLHDPLKLPDMKESVARIQAALREGERITVFCDYDADGTSGGCALLRYLLSAGADAAIMTPNRHKEGYGLSVAAVDQIDQNDSTLIVTVDCGITNIDEIARAATLGIDVIVTDHHECGEILPDTPYIINPKRPDSEYPCGYIAGCGVALKLIHALSSLETALEYVDLAALGTITDIVPLTGENRAIAALGIRKMRENPCAGIAALAGAANIALEKITSFGVSFGLGPRINAAGRMDTAQIALDILGAQRSSKELDEKARALCALNDKRKQEVTDIVQAADDMVRENEYMKDSAILLADAGWNAGVIGIAAAKIADKYTRPCVLFGGAEGLLVGSARSVPAINMHEVLAQFSDRYEKFGGHAQAAGLTIRPEILSDLRRDVCAYINESYDETAFAARLEYDMQLKVGDVTAGLVRDIARLEPFGHGNDKPVCAVFGADISDTSFVGKNGAPHLRFAMKQNGASAAAVYFYFKEAHSFVSRSCDFLCEAEINDYTGKPQMIVRKIASRFDTRLVDSFIKANRRRMTRAFLDEMAAFGDNEAAADTADIEQTLVEEIGQSRFGLCIVAPTEPALSWLLRLSPVDEALRSGRLKFFDERAYSADNCIAAARAAGHERVMTVGLGALGGGQLREAYAAHAEQMFLGRPALLSAYAKLKRAAAGAQTADALAKQMNLPAGQAAFALRVFSELDLIEKDKSGRILAIKNTGEKKELMQSACYQSFCKALGHE